MILRNEYLAFCQLEFALGTFTNRNNPQVASLKIHKFPTFFLFFLKFGPHVGQHTI